MSTKILQQLNPVQQQVARAQIGPILVLAGAGSGKTRVLAHRIAYLIGEHQVLPEQILAVTFTNKAAEEMRGRVAKLLGQPGGRQIGPLVGTFHSVCVRILRQDVGALGIPQNSNFTIYDTDDSEKSIRAVLEKMRLSTQDWPVRWLRGIIEQVKSASVNRDEYWASLERSDVTSDRLAILRQIFTQYESYLAEANAFDFQDLLSKTVELWQAAPAVLRAYQQRFRHVLVDEYQDTNHQQNQFCRLLACGHRSLFVVGDDYQSIYSFRGANINHILNFTKDWTGAQLFLLEQNYRSTQQILDLANVVIKKNQQLKPKVLWTSNQPGPKPWLIEVDNEQAEAEFIIRRISGSADQTTVSAEANPEAEYVYDEDEPVGILDRVLAARRLERADQPAKPSRAAITLPENWPELNRYVVLYRTNAQSRALEEALMQYNVPYRLIGGVRFYDRREIKDLLAYLRVLANPRDLISLKRIVNLPPRGIGPKTFNQLMLALAAVDYNFSRLTSSALWQSFSVGQRTKLLGFADIIKKLQSGLPELTVSTLIRLILKDSGYIVYLKQTEANFEERQENLNELQVVAERFASEPGIAGLRHFLEDTALHSDIDNWDPNAPALTLMTVHAAKGLEFPVVFMVGLEQGLFPHSGAQQKQADLEEERRLFYVGVTRAEQELYLLYARSRNRYGTVVFPDPSEFIRGLGEEMVESVIE